MGRAAQLGLAHFPTSEQAFDRSQGDTIHVAGRPVIRAKDEATREAAVRFAVEAQALYAELLESQAAASAYGEAEGATDALKRHVERLQLTPAFPLKSTCDLCRDLISGG